MTATIDVPRELAALERMTAGGLREKYRQLFGQVSRSGNRQWLLRRCAWRVQALVEGDLSDRARRRAEELARDVDLRLRPPVGANMPPRVDAPDAQSVRRRFPRDLDARLPMPGTRLKRPYKGHVYEVEVLDKGFLYEGEVYQSLSAIAHTITGSHWNGFLFFGLNDPRKESA